MSRYYKRKNHAGTIFVVIILIAAIAGVGVLSKGFQNWDVTTWFSKSDATTDPPVDEPGEPTEPVDPADPTEPTEPEPVEPAPASVKFTTKIEDGFGIEVSAIEGVSGSDIRPGDSLLIELKGVTDDAFLGELGLTFTSKPLTSTFGAFEAAFRDRDDLLDGPYSYKPEGGTSFTDFDMAACLAAAKLSPELERMAKLEFLKLFAEQNRLGLAFSATVVFACEVELGEASEHYVFAKSENNNDTYAVMDSQIFMFIDERIKIQVNFGEEYIEERYVYKYRDYVPKITVTNENNLGIFPNGTYTAQNLNCFMFQEVEMMFSKIVS